MQVNNPTPSSLKRPFAQTASVPHQTSDSPSASSLPPTPKSQRRRRSTSPHQGHQPMSSPRSHSGRSTPGSPRTGSPSGRGGFRSNSPHIHRDGDRPRNNSRSRLADREKNRNTLELPLRDENLIKQTYKDINVPSPIADNPKNSLANFASQVLDASLDFKHKDGMVNKQKLWRFVRFAFPVPLHTLILCAQYFYGRSTVTLELDPLVVGEGDAPLKKDSEKLAALSAVYQLVQRGLVSTSTGRSWLDNQFLPPQNSS